MPKRKTAKPNQKPMSDAVVQMQEQYCWNCKVDDITKIIRAVEAHHGIGREDGK